MAAEADDLDALDEKVIQINRNTISKNSRAVYDSKKVHFIRWLDRNKQDLLSEEFLGAAERDAQGELKKAYIKAVIDGFDQGQPAPVRLAELTAKDIQLFVASLKKRDGTVPPDLPSRTCSGVTKSSFPNKSRQHLRLFSRASRRLPLLPRVVVWAKCKLANVRWNFLCCAF